MATDYRKGLKYVFATALVSGFAIFVNKFFVGIYNNAFVYTTVKNTVTALILLSAYTITKDLGSVKKLTKKDWVKLASIGVVGGSIPFLLFFQGLSMTSAVNSAFIHKTMFIFVAVMATFTLKEKLNLKHVTAAAILFAVRIDISTLTNRL